MLGLRSSSRVLFARAANCGWSTEFSGKLAADSIAIFECIHPIATLTSDVLSEIRTFLSGKTQPVAFYTFVDGFYTPKRIYKESNMLCMFDKHAIWCQCASMVPFTMAVASLFSCQWITLSTWIYWTFVFWCAACIQFVSAEHGPFIVSTPTWQNARLYWNFTVHVIVFVWTMNNWDVFAPIAAVTCLYFLIGKYLFKYGYYLTVATVYQGMLLLH